MSTNKTEEAKHEKKRETKKKNYFTFTLIQLILVIIMIYSGTKIYKWYIDNNKNTKLIEGLKESVIVDEFSNEDTIDFKSLKEKNSDTVAWIKVEGTDIDYPVVQTNNNDYYLNHSFDKSVNGAGWVFADYKNKFDGTDKNIVIYGHNRRDGSMFSSLKNILKSEWYNNENNRYIELFTEQENLKYEVLSVYQTEKEDYYIKTDFSESEFDRFLLTIKNRSLKNFNVDANENDSILTLSTCANDNKYRVVLHAKKINEEVGYKGEKNGDK